MKGSNVNSKGETLVSPLINKVLIMNFGGNGNSGWA